MNEVGRDSNLLAISGTVGSATVVKLPSHIPARPRLCLCIVFQSKLLVLREFAVFVMPFFLF
jgi:hypothetical protein